jgi:acyl-CoA dehydrogenase
VLAGAYQALPIGITVEGANILTRSMIIYGQGAIRCHPFVQQEMRAAAGKDVRSFDAAFFGHVGFVFEGAARAFVHGLTGARFVEAPAHPFRREMQALARYSGAFALISDVAMATLGGTLKRREMLSGRFADALSWMFLASAVLKRFRDDGEPAADRHVAEWSMQHALHEVERALRGILDNLPGRLVAKALALCVFPFGAHRRPPSDAQSSAVAKALLDGGELRERLTRGIYLPPRGSMGLGQLEHSLALLVAARPLRAKLKEARSRGEIARGPGELEAAVQKGILTEAQAQQVRSAEQAQHEAILVDAFGEIRRASRSKSSESSALESSRR